MKQGVLTIGDRTDDGLLEIVDTNWDSNGTLRVTVRELIGGGDAAWVGGMPIRRMRTLARRALPEYRKGQTRSSRVIHKDNGYGQDSGRVTFAVSRLED